MVRGILQPFRMLSKTMMSIRKPDRAPRFRTQASKGQVRRFGAAGFRSGRRSWVRAEGPWRR